jgi:hypothetical protein
MKLTLSYYTGLMREAIANDKDKMALYAEIDKHRTGAWQTPQALQELPWIKNRKFASTKPADALDSGTRTFATLMPDVSIAPLSDHPDEYERVEKLETAIDWHLQRINIAGDKTAHWRILESAMRYCAVKMQTEYLPHTLRGQEKDRRNQAILRQSKFQWTIHHPSSVHHRRSKNILEMAGLSVVRTAQDLIDEFGEDNEGIIKMLEGMRNGRGAADAKTRMTTKFSYYDVTDWENRCQWIVNNGGSDRVNSEPGKGIELRLMEHKMPFIPWVIVDNEDPILKNAINTGLLDNDNIIRTIVFSKAIASAAESKTNIETPDGTLDGVTIDNTNPTQPMVTRPGVRVQELRGSTIDPQLSNMLQMMEAEASASTVMQGLSDAAALDSRNFSTANLKYKAILGQLSLAKDCAARAEQLGIYQMFEWVDYARDKPLVAFRKNAKTFQGAEMPAGEELVVSNAEDMNAIGFDLEHLYVEVTLREDSLMDEQSKINMGVTKIDRFGYSRQLVAEELGEKNYSLHEQKRAAEELVLAQVQAQAREIMGAAEAKVAAMMGQVQMQIQQAQMQAQQEAQAQQMAQQQPQNAVQGMNAGGSFASQQGQDMRGGMMPAMQNAPGEGREQINGMDAEGAPLA